MVAAVRVGKAVQGVLLVYAKSIAGDKHRTRRAKRNIALAAAHSPAAHRCGSVVARTRADYYIGGQTQRLGGVGGQRADRLPAFKQFGQLGFAHTAEVQHLAAPAFMLYVQQKHTRSVRVIGAVDAGQLIVDVILRQHDFFHARKVFRLVVAQPKQLGRGESGKGDVRGVPAQGILADDFIQVVYLLLGAPVIPQDAGADDGIIGIQHDQPMHLPACADALYLRGVKACQQLGDAAAHRRPPVCRVLLAPAGAGIIDRVLAADDVGNAAGFVHQQQLDRRCAKVDSDIIHSRVPYLFPKTLV